MPKPVAPYEVLERSDNASSDSRWQWERMTVKDANGDIWHGQREMDDDWEYYFSEWDWTKA